MNARFEPKCILRRLIGQRSDLARFAQGHRTERRRTPTICSFFVSSTKARPGPICTPLLKAPTKALTKLVRGFGPGLENKRKHLCICEEVSVAFALNGLMVAELKC